jgi:DNA-binding transcriptional LysR family regulator
MTHDRWLGIQVRQLVALRAVARDGSFREAANSLGYVQSAISRQIGQLERATGTRLLERRSGALTEAGEILLHHAGAILEQLEHTRAELTAAAPLTVGVQAPLGDRPLAALAACDRLRLVRGPSEQVLADLAGGALDAALVELPLVAGQFSAVELGRRSFVLAVPARAVGHGERPDPGALLERLPLVDIPGCGVTQALARRVGTAGHAADTPASALAFVRTGMAAAVVPRDEIEPPDFRIATVDLPDVPDRGFGIAWRRDRDADPALAPLRRAAREAPGQRVS